MNALRRSWELALAALGGLCVAMLAMTVLLTVLQVVFRYVLDSPLSWSEELARWLFVWTVFPGCALLIARQRHMRMEFLTSRLAEPHVRKLDLLSQAVMTAACIAMLVHGWDFCSRVSGTSGSLEWPSRYLYMAVPVGAGLSLLCLAFQNPMRWTFPGANLVGIALGMLAFKLFLSASPWLTFDLGVGWMLHIVALGLMFLDVPIAYCLVFAAFASFAKQGDLMLLPISQSLASSVNSFLLLSIPFFIVAAQVMNASGITRHLIGFAAALVGHMRGGLAQVNVVTNTVMGGLSGSSLAVAVGTAKVLVPEMERRGYPRPFAAAVTSCASTIDNLIPPSIGMIIFAAAGAVSVGALFTAGIFPGLLMAAALMLTVHVQARRRGLEAGTAPMAWPQRRAAFRKAIPALLVPLFVVLGMRGGAFTASEAGAIAVVYAVLIGVTTYRELQWRHLPQILQEALVDTIAIIAIVAASAPFGWALGIERIPQKIAQSMAFLADNKWLFLLVLNVFLLLVGLAMEYIASLVILVPILMPIAVMAGIDPVHLGIIMVMNLVLGALTPPLGVLVFATASIARVKINEVYREVMPFFWALLGVLALVTYFPWISLALNRWLAP
jgi:tripartite ATP-independent transporter DctM subunit